MTEPYETAAPNSYQWTDRAFGLLMDEKLSASVAQTGGVVTAVVHGECPRCGHSFSFSQVLSAAAGESVGTFRRRDAERPPADYAELTVSCRCDEQHSGRPEGVDHGCGINFRVDVLPDAG